MLSDCAGVEVPLNPAMLFALLLLLNLSPLFLCKSEEAKRGKKKDKKHESDEDDEERRRFIIKQNHPQHCRFWQKNQEPRKIVKFLNPDVEKLNEVLSRSTWIFRNLATLSIFHRWNENHHRKKNLEHRKNLWMWSGIRNIKPLMLLIAKSPHKDSSHPSESQNFESTEKMF